MLTVRLIEATLGQIGRLHTSISIDICLAKSRVRLKQIDILYFNSIQWVHLCPLFLMNQVLKDPSQLIVSNTSNGIPKLDKKIAVLNKE